MTDFLRDFLSRPGVRRTVILMEPDSMSAPRQYDVRPGYALYTAAMAIIVGGAVLAAAVVLTPLRGSVLGPGSDELRAAAERNAARAEALEDALTAQAEEAALLRGLITGDSTAVRPDSGDPADRGSANSFSTDERRPEPTRRLPLGGTVSRGFLPARGHYGLDVATDAGTPVRATGAGTVVFADRTQSGGLTIAVQQADGYLLVYTHNSRLMHRQGDRVEARDTLALSGNTGEPPSGPHLHVEVWNAAGPVDPASFFPLR